MRSLHISPITNRKSIEKHGLVPSEIPLEHHKEGFVRSGYLKEDKNKMLYTWVDCNQNERFIKDMIYCKVWQEPRNKLWLLLGSKKYLEQNKQIKEKFLYYTEYMLYDVYLIKDTLINNGMDTHWQGDDPDNIESSQFGFDNRFAHQDKPLGLRTEPTKNIKRIGLAEFEYRNKKYNIRTIK